MSASGNPSTSGFGDLDGNNIVVAAEGRVRTDFFGFTGHQTFGTTFSNKKANSIDQRLDKDVIENSDLQIKKGSWNIYYNFDQYLYEPKKGADQGIGLFGRLGVSDGNPNFMKFFASFGMGGKGMFDGRPNDKFGIGYYFININNPTIHGPASKQEIFTRRVRTRGLLQCCHNTLVVVDARFAGPYWGSEKDDQARSRSRRVTSARHTQHWHNDGLRRAAAGGVLIRLSEYKKNSIDAQPMSGNT
jgi:hypothetical protein